MDECDKAETEYKDFLTRANLKWMRIPGLCFEISDSNMIQVQSC